MSLNTADSDFASVGKASRGAGMERIVPPAMLVVAIAMGVAGHLHLGLTSEFAAAVGLSLFCIMLLCHVLLRVADAADRAAEAEEERLAGEVASPIPVPAMPPAPPMSPPARPVAATPPAAPRSEPAAKAPAPSTTTTEAAPTPPTLTGWDFRPSDADNTPPPHPQLPRAPSLARPTPADTPAHATTPRRETPAHVDDILRRLAEQIRSGGAAAPAERIEPALPALGSERAASSAAADATAQGETALDQAVDALRSTVEAMRIPAPAFPAPALPVQAPTEPPPAAALPPVAEARLAAVAEALAAERANVYLEPILQLAEEQAHHFEVSVRLVDADGTDLDARQVIARAGNAELLSLLDAIGLRHAAGFALKLERRGRDGSVFSEIAGQSLADERFVTDASGRHAQGVADRLVLTFQQSEMRALGSAQLAALGDLARLGFRFAIQGVADLDMDFEALSGLGLTFVKLDAEVFLNGLICSGEEVPASDICRFFDDIGLQVIVGGIDSDILRQRITGCGVAFGQGRVFGEPRPIPVGQPAGVIAA